MLGPLPQTQQSSDSGGQTLAYLATLLFCFQGGGCFVSTAPLVIARRRFGETARRDAWWIQPLVVFLGLSTFLIYATWAAFQGKHYTYGPYLSPFYSPVIFGDAPQSWFGPR